ncbi:MAG: hemerythrin domain-containing protein [Bacteroidetes bacterium]|nr:hemerythrin domain-containing protein [Bacteroidota bacterium]
MNPKPQKRHQAIVSFSKEHHFGLLLCWKIRNGLKNGVEIARIKNYVLYIFEEDIAKHIRDEETLLFSQMPDDDPLIKRAITEHQELHQIITAIKQSKEIKSLLNHFASKLESHIRFEERVLLNYLQEKIAAEELEKISSRMPVNSKELDQLWKDCFWEKKSLNDV